ncbi:hypothetical protein F5Y10DRAFT_288553 [Nemania abortiva]|nr:hypothetical protein F5Y10DRAFT_288553 [Nemania abortiva]
MGPISFCIGIEIELLVELKSPLPGRDPRNRRPPDYNDVFSALQKWLSRSNIEAVVRTDENMLLDYTQWVIQGDYSLYPKKNCYGIELASRVLFSDEEWQREVETVWSVLKRRFEIKSDESCGTHVHISIKTGGDNECKPAMYNLDQLRKVSKSVVIYEDAVTELVPESRKSCSYCTSNICVPNTMLNDKYQLWKDHADGGIFSWIEGFSDETTMVVNMSPLSRDAPEKQEAPGFGGRYVSWNFTSLHKQGTIEFRRAPKSTSEDDTGMWVLFAMGFIAFGIRGESPEHHRWAPASLPELQRATKFGGKEMCLSEASTEILSVLYST